MTNNFLDAVSKTLKVYYFPMIITSNLDKKKLTSLMIYEFQISFKNNQTLHIYELTLSVIKSHTRPLNTKHTEINE